MGRTNNSIAVPPPGTDEPTVAEIKRALHRLSQDDGEALREVHDHLLELARGNGIDPDEAMQRSRAAAKLLRERLVRATRLRCG